MYIDNRIMLGPPKENKNKVKKIIN